MNVDRYINVELEYNKTFQEMRFLFHSFDFRILRENSFKHPLVNNHVVNVKGAQINIFSHIWALGLGVVIPRYHSCECHDCRPTSFCTAVSYYRIMYGIYLPTLLAHFS